MIRTGQMPSLDELLNEVAKTRRKYHNQIIFDPHWADAQPRRTAERGSEDAQKVPQSDHCRTEDRKEARLIHFGEDISALDELNRQISLPDTRAFVSQ